LHPFLPREGFCACVRRERNKPWTQAGGKKRKGRCWCCKRGRNFLFLEEGTGGPDPKWGKKGRNFLLRGKSHTCIPRGKAEKTNTGGSRGRKGRPQKKSFPPPPPFTKGRKETMKDFFGRKKHGFSAPKRKKKTKKKNGIPPCQRKKRKANGRGGDILPEGGEKQR